MNNFLLKQTLVSVLIGLLVGPFAFWLGGYNFDERGAVALACYGIFLIGAVLTFLYPGWYDQ